MHNRLVARGLKWAKGGSGVYQKFFLQIIVGGVGPLPHEKYGAHNP